MLVTKTAGRDPPARNPTRQTFAPCCARAASGHAAALPSSVMNSRRFIIRSPRRRGRAAFAEFPIPRTFAALRFSMSGLLDGFEHLTAGGDRLGRYLREGDDAGRRALVHPVVDGAPLHQHVASLKVHAAAVKLHIDLA